MAKHDDRVERALQIRAGILTLKQEIEAIREEGEVAEPGCCTRGYWARGRGGYYHYQKLEAPRPLWPKATKPEELTKYRHLGKTGSDLHIEATFAIARRRKIDCLLETISELERTLPNLALRVLDGMEIDQPKPRECDAVLGGADFQVLSWLSRAISVTRATPIT